MKLLSEIYRLYKENLELSYNEREIKQLFTLAMHHIEGKDRKALLLDERTKLEIEYINCLQSLQHGMPIQYIFNKAFFFEMELEVNSSVLIPRPETEELVNWVVQENGKGAHTICDLGTGSGCIAISLARFLPKSKIVAVELYKEALKVAKRNAVKEGVKIEFKQLDILSGNLPPANIYVSNPPYIPLEEKESMSKLVTEHEPHTALFVTSHDPLLFYRRILEQIDPTKKVYFEIHEDLKDAMETMLSIFGFTFEFKKDLQDKYRMLRVN